MDYNGLIHDLLTLNTTDVTAAHKIAALLNDLTHTDTVLLLSKIRDLETTVNTINTLNTTIVTPDPLSQRERFINRLERLSECEAKIIPFKAYIAPGDSPVDEPYFSQMDVIYCDFGGVGWEYDGPHFAIVWEDNHSETELTVIPTTSQFTKEYADEFNVGRITGLPARDTIVSVKKMGRISRKRIIQHRGRYIQGRLHRGFKDRIENAIAISINLEKSLDYHVRNECRADMPLNISLYPSIRFTPVRDVQYDPATHILNYRKWNEVTTRNLQLRAPNTFTRPAFKKQIYDNIFSNLPRRITQGMTDYNGLYT